jgi:hypothetical protein
MQGKGIRRERETIINFNEEDATASIWTASEIVYRPLMKLGYQPSEDNERSAVFEVPKRDVRLPRPKKPVSGDRLERLREAGRRLKKALSLPGAKAISMDGEANGSE